MTWFASSACESLRRFRLKLCYLASVLWCPRKCGNGLRHARARHAHAYSLGGNGTFVVLVCLVLKTQKRQSLAFNLKHSGQDLISMRFVCEFASCCVHSCLCGELLKEKR